MAISDIITGQFVCIEQTPATVGDRIVARVIDYVAIVLYAWGVTSFILQNVSWRISGGTYVAFIIMAYLPVVAYTFLCELLFRGQTLGKRVMRIRVAMADGSAPTAGALLLRYVCEIVDIGFSCIGVVFIICTRHHQRLGDLAAGTIVIRRPGGGVNGVSLDEFAYARPGYEVSYPEAARLDQRQADIVQRVLASARGDKGEAKLSLLADKVRQVTGVRSGAADTRTFLVTVLNDYKHIKASE